QWRRVATVALVAVALTVIGKAVDAPFGVALALTAVYPLLLAPLGFYLPAERRRLRRLLPILGRGTSSPPSCWPPLRSPSPSGPPAPTTPPRRPTRGPARRPAGRCRSAPVRVSGSPASRRRSRRPRRISPAPRSTAARTRRSSPGAFAAR